MADINMTTPNLTKLNEVTDYLDWAVRSNLDLMLEVSDDDFRNIETQRDSKNYYRYLASI